MCCILQSTYTTGYIMNIQEIKKSMKLAMAHRGINQKELSIASGVGELTISRISKEKIMPTTPVFNLDHYYLKDKNSITV